MCLSWVQCSWNDHKWAIPGRTVPCGSPNYKNHKTLQKIFEEDPNFPKYEPQYVFRCPRCENEEALDQALRSSVRNMTDLVDQNRNYNQRGARGASPVSNSGITSRDDRSRGGAGPSTSGASAFHEDRTGSGAGPSTGGARATHAAGSTGGHDSSSSSSRDTQDRGKGEGKERKKGKGKEKEKKK